MAEMKTYKVVAERKVREVYDVPAWSIDHARAQVEVGMLDNGTALVPSSKTEGVTCLKRERVTKAKV
jgi:hypothetical protein